MNNLPKSIFIGIYPILAFAGLIYSSIQLYTHGFSVSDLGLLVCSAPMILILIQFYGTDTARTDTYLRFYSSIEATGIILSLYAFVLENGSLFNLTVSLVMGGSWVAYVMWYSVFGDRGRNPMLQKHNMLPEFIVENEQGEEINSNAFKGQSSIILFFRGNWCPLCMTQIKEIAQLYKELEKRNIQVILISPQPHGHTRKLAKKFDLAFRFLVDVNSNAAKKLGIFAKNGLPLGLQAQGYHSDTVLPTSILTNPQGEILHSDLTNNYRIRPEPNVFLEVFDQVRV